MKKLIVIVALVVAAGVFWKFSGDAGKTVSQVDYSDHSDHLSLIPADTLFYMGGLEPVNAKDMMASMSSMYAFTDPAMLSAFNDEAFEKLAADADSAGSKFALGLFKFLLQGLSDPQSMFAQTGAKETLFSSVYSVGLLPVIRYEADEARFDQFITRIEADAQVAAVIKQAGAVSYRSYPLGNDDGKGLDLVVAYHGGDAIFTLAITGKGMDQNLQIALGDQAPQQSLRQAGTLEKLKGEYNYLPESLGYLSIQQTIAALTTSDNLAGQMLAALDDNLESKLQKIRGAECAAEFADIAAVWPRWVMGYRSLDYGEHGFKGNFHMNMEINHPALTDILKRLAGHLPADMMNERRDIFSMAIGLDISKLDSVIGGLAQLAEGLQYQCEALQGLNGMADAMHSARPAVAMSTAMARGVKGLRVSLYDIDGDLEKGDVTAVDALISLSGDQVRALLTTLMAMNPGAQMVAIPEDGSPVALPVPDELLKGAAQQIRVMLAAKDSHAVAYTGETATELSVAVLNEPANADGLMAFSLDYGRYMSLFGSLMDAAAIDAEMTDQEKAEYESFRKAIGNIDYREQMQMRFTDKGLEFDGYIEVNNDK